MVNSVNAVNQVNKVTKQKAPGGRKPPGAHHKQRQLSPHAMQPQPSTQNTARKPGRGRPALQQPRRTTLPRVSTAAHAHLLAYAQAHQITLADALQAAILALPDLQRSTASNQPSNPSRNK